MPLTRLCERVGSTPFFAYDRTSLTERVALLRSTLPADLELSYAIKANPMPAVVQHLSGIVDSLDVASGAEMRVALDTPLPASAVSFAGPGKSPAELSQAVAAGVVIEVESPTEADRVVAAGERLGLRPQVALRVNPDFEVKGSGMRMGGGAQQFGIDAEAVPALMKTLADRDLDLLGFHVFAGSQNLHADILCEAQGNTVDLVLRLADEAPQPMRYVNLGGGFGIPYYEKDTPLDLPAIGDNLEELLRSRLRPALPDARVLRRARTLHRRRVWRLRHQGRRPQGVTGQDLPRRRRGHAPPARRLGELRPGDQAQLPPRHRQPHGRGTERDRARSSAACAHRSTCSATGSPCHLPTWATSWSCTRRAPTA